MAQVAEKRSGALAAEGISAEVIDPRTIVPLDMDDQRVRKTSLHCHR
jgi:pyruvate dehydrogenase E1 component beta subunit